ncbi:hypothetical protein AVEN_165994-1 [Araneus ventricosus]|uniref:Uncharacterized protein n=1 Tax=Araneus ventricosus TaxID=182803 RepID=A0A4Y2TSF0_ARAVE|nr:hypothetical protein AVEN_165994-1 [Araneus ventricosus]
MTENGSLFLSCTCESLEYEEHYITQQVDHFGFSTDKTYEQRYLANYKYYNPENGSIFFYTGNEGGIEVFVNNTADVPRSLDNSDNRIEN